MSIEEVKFTSDQIDRRAYSVAVNAVREMRVAYGRDGGPWTDDDCRRVNAIYDLLHLVDASEIDRARESFPLVAPEQAGENPSLDLIERELKRISELPPQYNLAAPKYAAPVSVSLKPNK